MVIHGSIEEVRENSTHNWYALMQTGDLLISAGLEGVVIGMADDIPLEYNLPFLITPTPFAYVVKEPKFKGLYAIHALEWNNGFYYSYLPREKNVELSDSLLKKAYDFAQSDEKILDHRQELVEFFDSKRLDIGDFLNRKIREFRENE